MTKDEVVAARRANLAVIADQFRSKTALAKRCGKSVQQIWGMIEGTASFGHRVARDIESSLGLPEKYLDVPNMAKADNPNASEDDGLIRIEALEPLPEYGLKAGTHTSEVRLLKVEKGWLYEQDIDTWRIKNLKLVTAPNDAMEPTIPEGAAVIIDHAQRTINYDGLFAVSYDGKLVIHRIQCLPGNSFYLLSDNPRCETITIDSLKGIHILGRCLGALSARRF